MIQQRLQQWMAHPESLNEDTLFELRELLSRFPYFQTARLLYLKNLFLLKDASFKDELRKSVLYVADLSQLFYYIEGEHFVVEKHQTKEKDTDIPAGVDRTLALIDRFLSDTSTESSSSLSVQPEPSLDYAAVLLQEESGGEEAGDDFVPLKGQSLIDNFIENAGHSTPGLAVPFLSDDAVKEDVEGKTKSEYPMAGTETESGDGDAWPVSEEPAVPAQNSLPYGEEMTELSAEKAQPESLEKDEDDKVKPVESEKTAWEDESYCTETMAKIYVKQQRYEKALEIIKKLNLKYPKKNAYFADQIRFLEKLIINAKSK